jgi:hypothetical protein
MKKIFLSAHFSSSVNRLSTYPDPQAIHQFTLKTLHDFLKIRTSGDKFFYRLTGYKATFETRYKFIIIHFLFPVQ